MAISTWLMDRVVEIFRGEFSLSCMSPDLCIVLHAEAGLGRSSKRKIPYIAIYNHNLKIKYTQDLLDHPDKVYRNLDVNANDVTAIVTGEKSKRGKGKDYQSNEKDLIVIPPLHVKYGTYHQQYRFNSKSKSSSRRRRGTAKGDEKGAVKVYYMFMSEFPTNEKCVCARSQKKC